MTTSGNEWQQVTTNDKECYNEWQRVAQRMKANEMNESDFRFQSETIMQCITTIFLATTSFWKYNVKQKICRSSHWRCTIKKAALNNFAIFTGKHLKACNVIKKRLGVKCFPVNIAKFLRVPILINICEWLLLCLFLMKTRDTFAAAKIFIK